MRIGIKLALNFVVLNYIVIIIIFSLSHSSAGYRPPSKCAISPSHQLVTSVLYQQPFHLVGGHPSLRLPSSIQEIVFPSVIGSYKQIWPAPYHFRLIILQAMSFPLGLCRITSLRNLYFIETPRIAFWATLNSWTSRTMTVHDTTPMSYR